MSMMVIAQRQHKSMSAGNRSPVDMVRTDSLINYTMRIARVQGKAPILSINDRSAARRGPAF